MKFEEIRLSGKHIRLTVAKDRVTLKLNYDIPPGITELIRKRVCVVYTKLQPIACTMRGSFNSSLDAITMSNDKKTYSTKISFEEDKLINIEDSVLWIVQNKDI